MIAQHNNDGRVLSNRASLSDAKNQASSRLARLGGDPGGW